MYEVLIQRLEHAAGGPEGIKMAHDAADAIAALQAENTEKDQIIEALTIEVSDAETILDAERKHNIRVEAERDHYKRKYEELGAEYTKLRTGRAFRRGAQGEG